MTQNVSGWLPNLLGPVEIQKDGVATTARAAINFVGCTITDDPTNDRTNITPPGSASVPTGTGLVTVTDGVFDAASLTMGAGMATFIATPSGANLAAALTSALPASKGGTGLTSLGSGVATFLGTPSGANLASALTTALPASKGGTGLTALGTGVATFLGATCPTFPSGTIVGTSDSQVLTGKTIDGASNTLTVRIASDVSGLGTGVATFLGTPSGANLASALTTALPDTKGGTGLTALGSGVATFLGTPSGANLAAALTSALPASKGGTGLTSLGSGVATFLGTCSSANLLAALTTSNGTGLVCFDTSPTISGATLSGTPTLSGASTSTSNDAKGTATDVNPVHVQTTDATVTTLDSFTLASNTAVTVSWLVTAVKSDLSQAASYSVTACFKNNAGTVAQVGSTTTTNIAESDSAWDATADFSGTTIRLRITGKAATTIQWTSILTRLTVVP